MVSDDLRVDERASDKLFIAAASGKEHSSERSRPAYGFTTSNPSRSPVTTPWRPTPPPKSRCTGRRISPCVHTTPKAAFQCEESPDLQRDRTRILIRQTSPIGADQRVLNWAMRSIGTMEVTLCVAIVFLLFWGRDHRERSVSALRDAFREMGPVEVPVWFIVVMACCTIIPVLLLIVAWGTNRQRPSSIAKLLLSPYGSRNSLEHRLRVHTV
jgi:hypothetical protein